MELLSSPAILLTESEAILQTVAIVNDDPVYSTSVKSIMKDGSEGLFEKNASRRILVKCQRSCRLDCPKKQKSHSPSRTVTGKSHLIY